ncbi:MAG: type II toxin-antitoxin system RelE/ParE family toxin [Bacteroidetes bacterium]|nr:type II toxin-antitoxin system RelE/ParE family toxin [Bacteroidota bacterium]
MKINYSTNKLRKQVSSASEIKKNFGVIAKRLSGRLDDIESAPTLAVLKQIGAAHCHPLSGDRIGQWSISVSGNYRIVFTIGHDPIPATEDGSVDAKLVTDITIIEIVDYH